MTAPEQMRACPTPWCSHDCTPYTWQGPSDFYTVICEECQVEGPYCATESEAIDAWNTRPAPAELVEALEELEGKARLGGDALGNSPSQFESCQRAFYMLAEIARTALRNAGAAS